MPGLSKLPLLLVPVLAGTLLTSCNSKKSDNPPPSDSTNVAAGDVSVTIMNFSFAPAAFTIHKGKRITFTNEDSTPHTATLSASAPEKFDSGALEQGKAATFTPMTLGTYHYVCTFHANMKASFTVVS